MTFHNQDIMRANMHIFGGGVYTSIANESRDPAFEKAYTSQCNGYILGGIGVVVSFIGQAGISRMKRTEKR